MDGKITAGSLVSLKSGSAPMTVMRVFTEEGVEYAAVAWMDAKMVHQTAVYATAGLTIIP